MSDLELSHAANTQREEILATVEARALRLAGNRRDPASFRQRGHRKGNSQARDERRPNKIILEQLAGESGHGGRGSKTSLKSWGGAATAEAGYRCWRRAKRR